MKVHLMNPDADFDATLPEHAFADDLAQDLQLDYLWDAMAANDPFLRGVARAATLQMVTDPRVTVYRQRALADTLHHREVVEQLYDLAVAAVNVRKNMYMFTLPGHPQRQLDGAVRLLDALTEHLEGLRRLTPVIEEDFASPAFRGLAETIRVELDEGYMQRLRGVLRELSFHGGILMSAGVGPGGMVADQMLRRSNDANRGLFNRTPLKRPLFSFSLPDRDEAGAQALADLAERSINEVANAASQALDHVQSFFAVLRTELGFNLACVNLVDELGKLGAPTCTPDTLANTSTSTAGLYDPCLALRMERAPVGNTIELETSRMLVVTGANHGGKSTLLRALGTAQLMMQAGMPVAAERFAARPVGAVFSHWDREEDTTLRHGKLDEELDRMERIVEVIRPGDLLLCNESFASTNEAEGSQMLLEVTRALIRNHVHVRSVTHLYDYASRAAEDAELRTVCLRAPHEESGARSYRFQPGEPLATSFGLDLYDQTFGTSYASLS